MVARLLAARERAVSLFDWTLVYEIDTQLAREGHMETAVSAGLERAVPVKRKPGRPRKIPMES